MHLSKTHYPLAEAAELAKCKPSDLLHQGVQNNITLLVGVPDWVDVRVYDGLTKVDDEPFLFIPELLALSQPQCLKIELNGRTEQSDFLAGYFIESTGELKKIRPNYGRQELNHQWVYWRTFRENLVNLLELMPDRLFVTHSDLAKLIEPVAKASEPQKDKPTARKTKPDLNNTNKQQSATNNSSESAPSPNNAELAQSPQKDPAGDITKQPKEQHKSSPESTTTNHVMLRISDVKMRTGLSRSTIYDRLDQKSRRHDPTFPKSVSLGLNSVGWIESEITNWIDSRKNVN